MSPRLLGGLLVLSLALNAFAIAGGVTVWRELKAVEARVAERLPPPQPSFRQAMGSLSPETRVRVREALRAAALAARPDFERAREARRQAIVRSGAAQLDRAAVFALLAESREAELRGRIRLEAAALDLFETLTPEERAILSPIFARRFTGPRRSDGPLPPVVAPPQETLR
ncbi:MAG: periplasmic heavy metal sensor [Brevundimonas sp.]|jgi:uncharacterized membrane protein|uniref:periplasmic heavy metal sensor n=1 Tax=Brevundimonas sp. TaxID=1871086 RepID=UPI0022BE15F4|nr:periplasmic heavy metal sensor [Brevundimonas sp.]MCZ8087915.1 periplasmic heavy metal sensor [Brevundimonas sp.]MCZ8194040.1 periplasmic heavy metal sensor [Brevundimonas sp.]